MIVINITAVAAFDIVGSIMVVALMITPCAAAYLLAHRIQQDMIFLSLTFAVFSAIGGYFFAAWADVSIAGSIACATGALFLGVLAWQKAKFF
jgi:manganese/zinc/iron transport system permease protein